jgi:hypothetical protein
MRTGRNALCPCGSGRKYKVCCLPADREAENARYREQEAARARAEAAAAEPARPAEPEGFRWDELAPAPRVQPARWWW